MANLLLSFIVACTSALAFAQSADPAIQAKQEDEVARLKAAHVQSYLDLAAYPPDRAMPETFKTFAMKLPFAESLWIKIQQPNNNLYYATPGGVTHGPEKSLRYALDLNTGNDVAGVPVLAAADGTAYVFGDARPIGKGENGQSDGRANDNGGLGNIVVVDHGNGIATLYAHLDEILVSNLERVTTETVLGKLGRTGATGGIAHVHFQAHMILSPLVPLRRGFTQLQLDEWYYVHLGNTVPFVLNTESGARDSRTLVSDFFGLVPLSSTEPQSLLWFRRL